MEHDPLNQVRSAIRGVLDDLVKGGRFSSLSDWCSHAEMPESTVRMFLAGKTKSLTLQSAMALAKAADIPTSRLLGETPARRPRRAPHPEGRAA